MPPRTVTYCSISMKWNNAVRNEPIIHFFIIGFFIWLAAPRADHSENRYHINISQDLRSRLATMYEKQYARAPSDQQLAALVDRHIREEIFWREGMALGLSEHDEIVRRRIIQKYEFLQSDNNVIKEPSLQKLESWYQENLQQFSEPSQVSFTHIYFSEAQDGRINAKERAFLALDAISKGIEIEGDIFPENIETTFLNRLLAERAFGKSDFTAQLFSSPIKQWSGPYQSGHGWHLLYIQERTPAVQPALETIKEKVVAEYQRDYQQRQNLESFKKLREKYTVAFEGGES